MAWCLTMSQARAVGRSAPWGAGREVFGRRSVGARLCRDATLGARRWQNAREMRFPASDSGKISARCVPVLPALARCRRGAFPGVDPWQFFASCVPEGASDGKTPVRGNISPACIQIHLIWQDMRAMHPKSPAKHRWGTHPREHLAAKGGVSPSSPRIVHGARILPPPVALPLRRGSCQLHRGIAFQLPGLAQGCLLPAPRRYPPPADTRRLPCPLQPGVAADGLRRSSSGAWPAVQAPRDRRLRHLDGMGRQRNAAQELGLDSRTVNKWAQNREAAGPAACVSAAENAHRKDGSLLAEP